MSRNSSLAAIAVATLLFTSTAFADAQDQLVELSTAIANDDAALAERALLASPDMVKLDTGRGSTPLINAVILSKPQVVAVLLRHGADPTHEADDGSIGNAVGAAFFAINGSKLTGALADRPDPKGRATALEVLRLVIAPGKGLDVPVRRAGAAMTPLMIAAQYGLPDVVKMLLDAGAKPNATGGGKFTALDYANDPGIRWIRASQEDRDEVVRLLKQAGAIRKTK